MTGAKVTEQHEKRAKAFFLAHGLDASAGALAHMARTIADTEYLAPADAQLHARAALLEAVVREADKMRQWYRKQMGPDGPEVAFDAALAALESERAQPKEG